MRTITRADMVQALSLYRRYPEVQARDAVHAAVMKNNQVMLIITADRHFDRFVGLQRVDPAAFERFLQETG